MESTLTGFTLEEYHKLVCIHLGLDYRHATLYDVTNEITHLQSTCEDEAVRMPFASEFATFADGHHKPLAIAVGRNATVSPSGNIGL